MTAKPKIDKAVMMDLYYQGKSPDEIASYFGTKSGENMAKMIQKELGHPLVRDKVMSLWLAGWGIERIMKECNATEDEIREVIFNGTGQQIL